MLPSEYPEVQESPNLRRLLATQLDMQFKELRTLLGLPKTDEEGGCNLTAATVLFNIIAGSSVVFYEASARSITERGNRRARFVGVLTTFFPWQQGSEVSPEEGAVFLYEAARNPLAHSLGLEDPAVAGGAGRSVALRKWPLTIEQITELEASKDRPEWARPVVSGVERAGAVITKADISVPALYFSVHRMLQAIFRDSRQIGPAEQFAEQFAHLWPQYSAAGAFITLFRRRRR